MMFTRFLFIVTLLISTAAFAFAQGSASTATTAVSATETKAKRPPIFRANKDQITQVQKMLVEKKMYSGEATGKFNDETRAAIKMFQKGNGLRETGTLNRATLEKMSIELTEKQKAMPVLDRSFASSGDTTTAPTKTAASAKTSTTAKTDPEPSTRAPIFRATTDQIKAAQKMLKTKSMYGGSETGKMDDDFRAGLKKFQEANNVKVTGTLNAVTLDSMGIALTDKQKADAAATPKPSN